MAHNRKAATGKTVLSRAQAREDKDIKIITGLNCNVVYAEDSPSMPLVAMLAMSDHTERARVSLPYALRILDLPSDHQHCRAIAMDRYHGLDTPATRFLWSDSRSRLHHHIVIASLFITTKPINEAYYECHDYTYYAETPSRSGAIFLDGDAKLRNTSGLTILDVIRQLTAWAPDSRLRMKELVRFIGLTWGRTRIRHSA